MLNKSPLVSIVMPTYNAGEFLRLSIESILNQTYKNFEFIIVDDSSTDETSKILKEYKKQDRRVKIITNKINLGVSRSANIAINEARGQFIARMDADDITISDRIEKQVNFLLKNKKTIAVGGQCELIDIHGMRIGKKIFPTNGKDVKDMIFVNAPLQQPTLMVNKSLLPINFVWYDNDFYSAEELELIFKLFKLGQVRNLKDIVLKYRIHDRNTSLINPKKTFYLTLKIRIRGITKYGYRPSVYGILATLAQILFILLVPSNWIFPIYTYLRGIRKIEISKININLDVLTPVKQIYQPFQR